MNALLLYFLAYAFLRSLSNGVDRLYETNFSQALSITAIVVGLVAAWHMRHVRIHRRLFTLCTPLGASITNRSLCPDAKGVLVCGSCHIAGCQREGRRWAWMRSTDIDNDSVLDVDKLVDRFGWVRKHGGI
jgi:hypothetical protein